MSNIVRANNSALAYIRPVDRTDWKQTNDPNTGYFATYEFTGLPREVAALEAQWIGAGCKTELKPINSTLWKLTVDTTNQAIGKAVTPTSPTTTDESWQLDTEFAMVPIWAHPLVVKDMDDFNSYNLQINATKTPLDHSYYKATIEQAIKKGKRLQDMDTSGILHPRPMAKHLFETLVRGQTDYREKRPVIRYSRSFPQNATSMAMLRMAQLDAVWAQGVLQKHFYIPDRFMSVLPTIPSNPPTNTAWGWVVTNESKKVQIYTGKIEETRSMTAAFWSTVFWSHVTA